MPGNSSNKSFVLLLWAVSAILSWSVIPAHVCHSRLSPSGTYCRRCCAGLSCHSRLSPSGTNYNRHKLSTVTHVVQIETCGTNRQVHLQVGVKTTVQFNITFVDHGTDTYQPSAGRLVAVHYLGCAARVICFCLAVSQQMASCIPWEPREHVCRFRNCAERYNVCKNINGVSLSCSSLGQTREYVV